MEKKEYLTVGDVSKYHSVTKRNIRRVINNMISDENTNLLGKDNNGHWLIHRLLLPKFKPQRVHKNKYYALTIDPSIDYIVDELNKIMRFIVDSSIDPSIEINYVIEKKKTNSRNHVHCYVKSNKKKNLIQVIQIAFSPVSYHQTEIFDLKGWQSYICKDGGEIIKIKK